ncbi:hypothetical protein TWF481_006717 [Arthrobotrys musiformis]|uniref:Uncharacterized protein n=1 Tax=Arthrobotrys musiformis TaxID=47236 RepID=A0AAV9WBD2_9PEZI
MTLPDADRKLAAIKRLSTLAYNSPGLGHAGDRSYGIPNYLSQAEGILEVLGSEYDESVALAVVRGLARTELKECIAAIMWDKEWKFETIKNILMATIRRNVDFNLKFNQEVWVYST